MIYFTVITTRLRFIAFLVMHLYITSHVFFLVAFHTWGGERSPQPERFSSSSLTVLMHRRAAAVMLIGVGPSNIVVEKGRQILVVGEIEITNTRSPG